MPGPDPKEEQLDLEKVRLRIADARGPRFWKSLGELASGEAFPKFLEKEFPRQAAELEVSTMSRRRLLELSLASMALGGLAACTRQP